MTELRVTKRDDGTTRYRVIADGGISLSGVAWEQIVQTDDEAANRDAENKMNEVAQGLGYEPPAPPPTPKVESAEVKPVRKSWFKS